MTPLAPFARRGVILALLVALPLSATPQSAPGVRLPAMGDSISEDLDLNAERKLGDQVMREVRRDPDLLDDPLLLTYVQSIWDPLVQAAVKRGDIGADARRAMAWQAFLVRDRSVNAMALPGGYVGVFLGLVATTATQDELAAVLAHELAHVSQRHIARAMTSSQRQSMLALAAMLAGMVAASKGRSVDGAQAAIAVSQAAMVQGQLNFSREMEREADRVGFGIFADAAFAPGGMAAMFEKLESAHRLNDNGDYPYLRSHPLTIERIGDARARVDALGETRGPKPTLEHELMRARARVLMDPRAQSLRRWQNAASPQAASSTAWAKQSPIEKVAAHYAAALASLTLRDGAAALDAVNAMQAAWRALPAPLEQSASPQARTAASLLHAQALALQGQDAQALALIDAMPQAGARAVLITRADLATSALRRATLPGHRAAVQASTEGLQAWVAERRDDALAWTHLARANELMGRRLRALRADAEAQAAWGDVTGAIDRLRAGQRLAREDGGDAIESAVIDARVRELLALRKDLYPDDRRRP